MRFLKTVIFLVIRAAVFAWDCSLILEGHTLVMVEFGYLKEIFNYSLQNSITPSELENYWRRADSHTADVYLKRLIADITTMSFKEAATASADFQQQYDDHKGKCKTPWRA